ncbi:hypothetical protein F4808DRAFT_247565 [Astrocystis sublimbata]|nr:hypothetical protein F4808DRAFT_247565 [Astrocystis sublimbata]
MDTQQSWTRSRVRILAVLATAIVFIFFWGSTSPGTSLPDTFAPPSPAAMSSDPVLSALKVSVQQASASPPKLKIAVTNTHPSPVTVFAWNSPLDALAVQLGLLAFTPEGKDAINIPTIQVRRLMPPGDDAYVTIAPGETEEREVLLKKPMVPVDQLQGKVKVVCKGEWKAVWAAKKEEISAEALKNTSADENALQGNFESEAVEMEF